MEDYEVEVTFKAKLRFPAAELVQVMDDLESLTINQVLEKADEFYVDRILIERD